MLSKTFIWSPGSDEFARGWKLEERPDFRPGPALLVAHDALEHLDGGTILTDEWQAFGAMLFGRGVTGWFERHNTTYQESMGSDLYHFMREGDWPTTQPDPLPERLDNSAELVLQNIQTEIYTLIRRHSMSQGAMRTFQPLVSPAQQRCVDATLNWVRVGYHRAEQYWGKGSGPQVRDMFDHIYDTVAQMYSWQLEYGDRFIVRIDPQNLKVATELKALSHPQLMT